MLDTNGRKKDKITVRKSLRLPQYDYGTSGAYFVTICTRDRHKFFENDGLKEILTTQWQALTEIFVGITLDVFVIMPDHLHFILWIDNQIKGSPRLSDLIKSYKSRVSVAWIRYMKQFNIKGAYKLWQVSYHDHVIRNYAGLKRIRQYILNNPIADQWKQMLQSEEDSPLA